MKNNKKQLDSTSSSKELTEQLSTSDAPDKNIEQDEFIWVKDSLYYVGHAHNNMGESLASLDEKTRESFKTSVISFINRKDYSNSSYINTFRLLSTTLTKHPTNKFDTAWTSKVLKYENLNACIGSIRNFFQHWKSINPEAISSEALVLLMKKTRNTKKSKNVLSDNPELSWMTNYEYDALISSIWKNYENNMFSTSTTLMMLLSMQFARRPIQIANLKFDDIKINKNKSNSKTFNISICFPGVKDIESENNFRDSKFEEHPLPEHIFNIIQLQREEIKNIYKKHLNISLSVSEIEKTPIFTTASQIKNAAYTLENHFNKKWEQNLDHQLFHMKSANVSAILNWSKYIKKNILTPCSHRTGRPIKVTATRLRHTRARQLAREGVPLHVLSHWLGHSNEKSIDAYYNDPAETARKLDEAMAPSLIPLAMAFAGNLIENESQASRGTDPESRLEFEKNGSLKSVGHCGKHSFCATNSVPIPCYRCRYFEPLITAPHQEVLEALQYRQSEENKALHIGGSRNLLIPINLSADIRAVQNCIERCNQRKLELEIIDE